MKKYVLLCLAADLLSLVPILLSLTLVNIPSALSLIMIILIIVSNIILWRKSGIRKCVKLTVTVISILFTIISIVGTFCNPYWNSLNFRNNVDLYSLSYSNQLNCNEALEDFDYAVKTLKRLHPKLYKNEPEEFTLRYEESKSKLSDVETITISELCRDIEYVFSSLSDGHTYTRINPSDRRILKYYRDWTNDGYTFGAVNGISVDELFEKNADFYSFEAESWAYEWLYDDIVTAAGLSYLGFDTADGIEYTLISKDGEVRHECCSSEDYVLWDEYAEYNNIVQSADDSESFVSFRIDSDNSIAVLKLDSCTYNNEYINCLKEMFTEVKNNNIRNVAVDIRNNGGGSDQIITEFFRYLDINSYKVASMGWRLGPIYLELGSGKSKNNRYNELLFDGNLYLLTSNATFSSAMMFAEYVKDNKLGLVLGEAPGNDPNGCGEIAYFTLPNSHLFMQISTKCFYRADRECIDDFVTPDVPCDRDKAEEVLYRIISNN